MFFLCGFIISCKDSNTVSLSDEKKRHSMLGIMHGDDGYSILKHFFEIFNANRAPLFRLWVFRTTGDNYGIYQTRMFEISNFRSKSFAALYELDIGNIDTTYDILHKKCREFYPKSGWPTFNAKIKQNGIWSIPRYTFNDSINETLYSKQYLNLEFIDNGESYSMGVSGMLNLDKLHDDKSVAITNLLRIMKEEFGIDFLNFDFDGRY